MSDDVLNKIAIRIAEQETRIDEGTWKEIFDVAPDGMIVVDRDAVILAVNKKIVSMFDYPRRALIGKPVHMLLAAEVREQHAKYMAAFFRDPTSRPMAEGRKLPGQDSHGQTVLVQISISPVESYYLGFIGVATVRPVPGGAT